MFVMKKYLFKILSCAVLCGALGANNPLWADPVLGASPYNYLGYRVVTVQANDMEWDDGLITAVNDTVYELGWGVNLNVGNSDNQLIASGLYQGFNIPIGIDPVAGTAAISLGVPLDVQEFISSGRTRDDVRRTVWAFDINGLLDENSTPAEYMTGTLLDDGSIQFQGDFVLVIKDCVTHYVNARITGIDTTMLSSPLYHDMTLHVPNGTHSFKKFTASESLLPAGVQTYAPSLAVMSELMEWIGPGNQCFPNGHGGLVPKPIDPRKPILRDFSDDLVIGPDPGTLPKSTLASDGNLGWNPPVIPLIGGEEMTVPVYIRQADDTTVHVFNLFGHGYTIACMQVYGDSTMAFPGQLLTYDTQRLEDFYNFSMNSTIEASRIVEGNVGTVTPDQIAWDDATLLYSESGIYDYYYSDNVVKWTNGEVFSLMDTTSSTVDYFNIADAMVSHGDWVEVPVTLTIAGDVTHFNAIIQLPQGFEIMGDVRLFNPAQGQEVHTVAGPDGTIVITGDATVQEPFAAPGGVSMRLTVQAPDDVQGDYRLYLRNGELTTAAGGCVRCRNVSGKITVLPYLMGDMDGSGNLDVSDVVVLIRKILQLH